MDETEEQNRHPLLANTPVERGSSASTGHQRPEAVEAGDEQPGWTGLLLGQKALPPPRTLWRLISESLLYFHRGANTPASKINNCSLQNVVERRAHTAYALQTGSMVQWLVWLRHLTCRSGPGVSSMVGTRHRAAGPGLGRTDCRGMQTGGGQVTESDPVAQFSDIFHWPQEAEIPMLSQLWDLGGLPSSDLCIPLSTASFSWACGSKCRGSLQEGTGWYILSIALNGGNKSWWPLWVLVATEQKGNLMECFGSHQMHSVQDPTVTPPGWCILDSVDTIQFCCSSALQKLPQTTCKWEHGCIPIKLYEYWNMISHHFHMSQNNLLLIF